MDPEARTSGAAARPGSWPAAPTTPPSARASTASEWEDFAGVAGLEFIRIGKDTDLPALRNELRWNDAAFRIGR